MKPGRKRIPKYLLISGIVLALLFGSTLIASAMSGGDFVLNWTTSDGGGATFSSGGGYSLGGTTGQPDAAASSGGDYELAGGFWPPPPIADQEGGSGTGSSTADDLPNTGFAPHRVTSLPTQPAEKAHLAETDLWLEIPNLGVTFDIYEVPVVDGEWDVSWLGENGGYLAGTAFPTFEGNTVITAHVWNASGNPGPFIDLKTLSYGDEIIIHAFGQTYTYEVRDSFLVRASRTDKVIQHEELDWVTLLTCETYLPGVDTYLFRRAVKAVLVAVE